MEVDTKEQNRLLPPLLSSITSKVKMAAGSVEDVRSERTLSLDALLEGVTEENLHAEVGFGSPVGNEAW
jgi:antitoxin component of MazEF toxin-antitoxin module